MTGEDPDLLTLPAGRRAQFWQGGDLAGSAVFFFHGCPDCRRAAHSGEAAARRAGVRLVAVNRPGYGLSDPDDTGHLSVADDTVAIADLLGIDRFAVLGMSLGGPYALACAVRHPHRVSAAGLVSAPAILRELDPPLHRDDLSPAQQALFERMGSSTLAEAIELVRPDFEAFLAWMAPGDADDDALARRWTQGLHPLDVQLLAALPAAEVAASVREALARTDGYLRDAALTFRSWEFRPEGVRCPTWLWHGTLDVNASLRNGLWFSEHIRGSTLVVRPGTSHLGTLMQHWDDILPTLGNALHRQET